MDILGGLNRFKEDAYNTVLDYKGDILDPDNQPGSPQHGKPDDYGLRGGRANYPMNSMGGRRMAGQGIAGAIAGEAAPYLVEPARKILQPAFNFLLNETFATNIGDSQISRS